MNVRPICTNSLECHKFWKHHWIWAGPCSIQIYRFGIQPQVTTGRHLPAFEGTKKRERKRQKNWITSKLDDGENKSQLILFQKHKWDLSLRRNRHTPYQVSMNISITVRFLFLDFTFAHISMCSYIAMRKILFEVYRQIPNMESIPIVVVIVARPVAMLIVQFDIVCVCVCVFRQFTMDFMCLLHLYRKQYLWYCGQWKSHFITGGIGVHIIKSNKIFDLRRMRRKKNQMKIEAMQVNWKSWNKERRT